MIKLIGVLLAFLVVGCNDEPVTAKKIVEQLQATGIAITDIQTPDRTQKSPVPNSYKDHITFVIPSVAPKGGQVFTCDKKQYCDAIYAYFDAFRAFAGPYIYQSKNGLIVAQFNDALPPETAEKLAAVIMQY